MSFRYDVTVIGGCGHVGLPLALAFADRGQNVAIYDINADAVDMVMRGELPASEPGAAEVLERVVSKTLIATTDPSAIAQAEHVVVVIGTPVDEHLNPDPQAVSARARGAGRPPPRRPAPRAAQHRLPGRDRAGRTADRRASRTDVDVAFCPERIAEGKAMTELFELPQIVSRVARPRP